MRPTRSERPHARAGAAAAAAPGGAPGGDYGGNIEPGRQRGHAPVCVALCDVVDGGVASVGLLRPESAAFEIVADVTAPDWDFADDPGDLDRIVNYPSYQRVLKSQGAFLVSRTGHAGADVIHRASRGWPETYVLSPLCLNEECLGYIGVDDRRPGQFDQDVINLDRQRQLADRPFALERVDRPRAAT